MSDDLSHLAAWLTISADDAAELLDVLAWVRKDVQVKERGFPNDEPKTTDLSVLIQRPGFRAEMLAVAEDFEVSPHIIEALEPKSADAK